MNTFFHSRNITRQMLHAFMALMILIGVSSLNDAQAQTTVCSGHTQNNGASSITFNVQNTNGYPIEVTTVSCYIGAGSQAIQVLYNTTPIASSGSTWSQGTVGAGQNGWVSAYTGTQTIATAGVNTLSNTLSIIIPSGSTYGFAISSNSVSYMTLTAGAGVNTFTNNGVNILTGDNISWGGGTYPANPVNYPRGFHGCIAFVPVGPCTDPPIAGTPTATSTNLCLGQSAVLGITGGTGGTGQTYQWMSSSTPGGPYTALSSPSPAPSYTVTPTTNTYYVCEMVCGTGTATSAEIAISVPPPFPGGSYTINNALPTGGTNFNSFTAAAAAISCGIAGPIVFDVDPASGPYTEQITLPATIGSNSVNTVTFNGNGRTLRFQSTNTNARHVIKIDGADYISINDLSIDTVAGTPATPVTYHWGIHLLNGADYNTVSLCNINTNKTSTTLNNHHPIVMSNSLTSGTTAGNSGNYNTFADNTITGGYYGITMTGAATPGQNIGNSATNNNVRETYSYGIYMLNQRNGLISGNNIERPTRLNSTTSGGVFMTTGCVGNTVENNRIHNMFDALPATNTSTFYGVYCSGTGTLTEPNRVINNVIYHIRHNGALYGVYCTSPFMNVWHNTISFDHTAATAGLAYGIFQTTAYTGLNFRNNVITLARGGSGAKVGLYYATGASTIVSNNNVVWIAGAGTGTRNYGNYNGTNFATLANWQTANSGAYDANSVQANPVYAAPGSGDFTPTAVATNNVGTNLGVLYDINGNPRSNVAPDAGAYEYSLPGLDAGITWLSPTSPTTAGMKTISVNIVNNLSNTITDLVLSYTDGITPVTETFSGLNLLSGTSQVFNFSTQYNVTASVLLRAYINSVNGISDDNAGNDTTAIQNICLSLSGAYTIDSTMATGGSNFQSFTALASALNCGGVSGPVTVDVVAGAAPYNQQVTFGAIQGISATNTITINGNSNTLTSAGGADYHTLRLNGADYMIFNNLNVISTGATNGFALLMSNGSDYNQFLNCSFTAPLSSTSSLTSAVALSNSTTSPTTLGNTGNYNLFDGCTMTAGYYCVSIYGNSTVGGNVIGNQFLNCNVREFYLYGFYNAYATSTIVRNCIIERPTRTPVTTTYGAFLTTNSLNCLFESNHVRNLFNAAQTSTSTCYGFYCSASATLGNENKFINNIVSGIRHNGLLGGLYFIGAIYLQAYHNTIILDHAGSTAGTTYGIYNSNNTGVDIQNNNVFITRGGTGTKWGLYYTGANGVPATTNYNNVYIATAGTNNAVYANTTSYVQLSNYQSVFPTKDQLSVSINPNFNNPSLGDYKPTEVTFNDLGGSVGVAIDYLGVTRGTPPDIGAIEFSVAPTDIGIFTFDAPNTSGCYSATQDVNLTIKNYGSQSLDFSVTPVTVYCDVQGPITSTLSTTISSGTLAAGASLPVTLSSFDMTGGGTYTFTNVYTSMTGDGNATNDYLAAAVTRTVGVVAGTVSATSTSICAGGTSPTLSLSGSYGGSIQWQESTMSATGPWTNVGTGTTTFVPGALTGPEYFYQAVLTCNSNTATSNVVTINVNSPALTGTTPGSRCGVGSVTLGATALAGNTVSWYTAATGGSAIGSGTTFNTPSIGTTTDFYAEAVSGAGSFTGLGCTQVPPSSGFNAKRGIQFDAYQSFTLNSFDFYAAYAGTTAMTIELTNSAGTILQTAVVNETSTNAAASWHTVTLNWIIPAGTGLRLLCQFNTGSLSNFSHSSGANYATTAFNNLGSVGLITAGLEFGPVVNPSVYYYFYNLSVSAGCNSVRTPVTATVVAPPAVTLTNSSAVLCVGQSSTLTASSSNPDYTYTWNPGNLSGASVVVTPSANTVYTLSAIDNTNGTFATCASVLTTTVTVNPNPTALTVSPSSVALCPDAIQPLVATGGTIGGIYTVGNGSTSTSSMGNTPYGSFYEGARVQYILRATELNALGMVAGNISSMAFNVTLAGPGTFAQSGFTVKMAPTAAAAFAGAYATPVGSFQTVYGPVTQGAPATGWNTLNFSSNFNWDGVSNILIDVCHDNDINNTCTACYSTSSTVSAHTTTFNSVYGTYNDNAQACNVVAALATTLFTTRPDIRFNSATPTNITWGPVSDLYTNAGATIAYTGSPSTFTVYTKPTAQTTYTVTATTSNGCTATTTAFVDLKATSSSNTMLSTCAPYSWNGNNYTASGIYSYTTMNAVGCDSVASLDLTILPNGTSTTTVTACTPPYVWNGNTYTASGLYNFTSPGANGCDSTATLDLTFNPCNTTVNLILFIQGYWTGSSSMAPTLSNQGQANPVTDCDSVLVELHDETTPSTITGSTIAVLKTDGTLSAVFPTAITGSHYIVVKHRNALETWSANPIAMGPTVTYNFSDSITKAYGSNMIQVGSLPDVFAIYSGDVVKDIGESTDLLDLGQVELEINNFSFGYFSEDLNGDGNVDILDTPILEPNVSNFVFSSHP